MNLLIIQARMGSSRLPGKVMRTIKGKPLLELQYERVRTAKSVDRLVVATTTAPGDDAIEAWCKRVGVDVFRGSEHDVLDRYYRAAKPYAPDNVIRVTSDCPLHHAEVIDFVAGEFAHSGCDYFSNSNHEPDVLEDGFDTEVFSFAALETAWRDAKLLSEREHVTPFIKNSGRFCCGYRKFDPAYRYKLSVDNEDDFRLAEAIFGSFADHTAFGVADVTRLMRERPELGQINAASVPNAGYRKSLEQEREVKP